MGSRGIKLTHHGITREQANIIQRWTANLEMPDDIRAGLSNALYPLTTEPEVGWIFMKISPEQFKYVLEAIRTTLLPNLTLVIWNMSLTYLRWDTGEILATREQLARDARTLPRHVSTAMTELVKIHAIRRERRGSRVIYFINPNVGWNGSEASRQDAAQIAPKLRLISDTQP